MSQELKTAMCSRIYSVLNAFGNATWGDDGHGWLVAGSRIIAAQWFALEAAEGPRHLIASYSPIVGLNLATAAIRTGPPYPYTDDYAIEIPLEPCSGFIADLT